jgi:putative endonuclease
MPVLLNSLRIADVYYTYVLQSEKDDKFYVGFTKDLKLRFEKHSKGQVESTRDRRPLRLIYYEACLDQNDATKREKYLKSFHGKMFIRKRLKSYLTG